MKTGLGSTALVLFSIAGIVAGCSSGSSDATSTSASSAPAGGATATPPASKPSSNPAGATASTDGATLFATNCAKCHGDKGNNGRAPKLAGKKISESEVADTVTKGKGRMPSFASQLSKDQIDAVAKYVSAL